MLEVHRNMYEHEWESGHFGYVCKHCGEYYNTPYAYLLPCSWIFEIELPEDNNDVAVE